MTEVASETRSNTFPETRIIQLERSIAALEYKVEVERSVTADLEVRTAQIEKSQLEAARAESRVLIGGAFTPILTDFHFGYPKPDAYLERLTAIDSDILPRMSDKMAEKITEKSRTTSTVQLSEVLQVGALGLASTAIVSIALWLFGFSGIINPFISILSLVVAPFFYAMGKVAKN